MVTVRQAYLAMFHMLNEYYWEVTEDEVLGSLLSSMSPYLFRGSISADPAVWDDWLDSVKKVSHSETLTVNEALLAIIVFLKFYENEFALELSWVICDLLDESFNRSVWQRYVENSLKNAY